ncbi:hypothetical protein F2Q69_00054235 [Brassica cretica]|uniref:Uncharacterized protein n=1 Tax=Brassica cretica TaxID=69181 RepID=A0A8S9N2C5_BRACR|nr:hypothetical protein F2Q69_00054235 [Brassica cretica]
MKIDLARNPKSRLHPLTPSTNLAVAPGKDFVTGSANLSSGAGGRWLIPSPE